MSPMELGRDRSLLEDRSRYMRCCSLAMSGGNRDKLLSFRYNDVRCCHDHSLGLRLRIGPENNNDNMNQE